MPAERRPQELLQLAERLAREAGDLLLAGVDDLRVDVSTKTSGTDMVSEMDRASETHIVKGILAARPDDAILGEETGSRDGTSGVRWVIDPLDGTTNFLHGFPVFSVSIAVKHRDKLEHGVVYDPLRNELFTASRGGGAQLNNRRIRCSNLRTLEGALIGTGFPFRANQDLDLYLKMFAAMARKTAGIRRAGSAALDLAYVAAGRMDGFWEFGLKEWDIAAGVLMIQEAGGSVGQLDGSPGLKADGNILGGGQKIFKLMADEFKPLLNG